MSTGRHESWESLQSGKVAAVPREGMSDAESAMRVHWDGIDEHEDKDQPWATSLRRVISRGTLSQSRKRDRTRLSQRILAQRLPPPVSQRPINPLRSL
jgi:hypothetical protein